jgi:hypothetical protein
MISNNNTPETYVDECYKVETYLRSYSHSINPSPGYEMWSKSNVPEIIPPKIDPPKPGRPKKVRKKHRVELEKNIYKTKLSKKGKRYACSICHQEGHPKKIHNAAVATTPTESVTFVASENAASQTSVTHTKPKLQVCLPSDF